MFNNMKKWLAAKILSYGKLHQYILELLTKIGDFIGGGVVSFIISIQILYKQDTEKSMIAALLGGFLFANYALWKKLHDENQAYKKINISLELTLQPSNNDIFIEILNSGEEAIKDMEVSISQRKLVRFLPPGSNLIKDHSYFKNTLVVNERTWAIEIPHSQYLKVTVKATGVKTGNHYEKTFELHNPAFTS